MFSPYHRLANCSRLERTITGLIASSNIPAPLLSQHNKYHYSLLHKLSSAKVHLENLQDALENTDVHTLLPNSAEFVNRVNMHIDSFFYCCGSALDILAREVLIYYNLTLPARVYFHVAASELTTHRPGDSLIPRLASPPWKAEFSDYRNALTHEVLIGTNFSIQVNADGPINTTFIVFPLPNDPRIDILSRVFSRNPNAYVYCKTTFTRILSLVNTIHGELDSKITTLGSLPL